MTKTVVITCFSHPGNDKYAFNPLSLQSDLQRVLAFVTQKVKCKLSQVVVITDLSPKVNVCQDIFREYKEAALRIARKFGFRQQVPSAPTPSQWLKGLIKLAVSSGINPDLLTKRLNSEIVPVLSPDTIIELASLFTRFRLINGSQDYLTQLEWSLAKLTKNDQLFFYYTGHGVRLIDSLKSRKSIDLVIQARNGQSQFLDVKHVQELFDRIPKGVRGLVIFDCCHASGVLKLPYSFDPLTQVGVKKISGIVFVASCREGESCGFYEDDQSTGSLFTYFFIQQLTKGAKNICQIAKQIDPIIQSYRRDTNRKPQRMTIATDQSNVGELFSWSSE